MDQKTTLVVEMQSNGAYLLQEHLQFPKWLHRISGLETNMWVISADAIIKNSLRETM